MGVSGLVQRNFLSGLAQRNFPTINYGFAYGSGVFVQPDLYQGHGKGGSAAGPMIDFIFVVDDPRSWHAQNIERNGSHYSLLKYLGPNMVCKVADHIGAGVYFNTLVPVDGQMVKYGVVSMQAFRQDLSNWSQLYVSGRLQKPVTGLASHPGVDAAVHRNLRSALTASLLLSPNTISLKDLFKRITSLSYLGDVRMGLAEDSKKVERIVTGSYEGFKQLYLPLLQEPEVQELGVTADTEGVQRAESPDGVVHLFSKLPSVLLSRVGQKLSSSLPESATAAATAVLSAAAASVSAGLPPLPDSVRLDIAAAATRHPKYRKLIKSGLRAIVANSSRRQAVAGLLYAGPVKTLKYVGRKLAKAWR